MQSLNLYKVENIVKQFWAVYCFSHVEDLLKALLKNSLKISPKKCQLFNVIFIKDRKVCVKPLRSRLEAIQKLRLPTTPKGCRSFAGMVNFLSMFCPELQKLLENQYMI